MYEYTLYAIVFIFICVYMYETFTYVLNLGNI